MSDQGWTRQLGEETEETRGDAIQHDMQAYDPETRIAQWIHRRTYPLGKKLGERVFDRLSHEKRNPAIQAQREPYSNTIANAFVTYLFLWSVPFLWEGCMLLVEYTAPADALPPSLWEMINSGIPFQYELYGMAIVVYGSFRLSTRLFDNFLLGSMEKGKSLAMAHAAIVFIVTGYWFQLLAKMGGGNGNTAEQPDASVWTGLEQAVDLFVSVATNYQQVLPFFLAIVVVQLAFNVVISGIEMKSEPDDPQTEITADRWKRGGRHSLERRERE